MSWITWIRQNWQALERGEKLIVSDWWWLGHPSRWPQLFTRGTGWPVGQDSDYMMALQDGSRIHVQCFTAKDGTAQLRMHRDRWDPDAGLAELVLHALGETPVGPLAALALVACALDQ